MAAPDRDTVYTTDGNRTSTSTTYTRESSATGWFVGIIVALALLAIGYLVFSANSTPSTTNTEINNTPSTSAPASTGTSTTPSTEAPASNATPMTEAPAAPSNNAAPAAPADTAPAAPADSNAAPAAPATPAQ